MENNSLQNELDISPELGKLLTYIGRVALAIRANAPGCHVCGDHNLVEDRSSNIYWLADHLHNLGDLGKPLCQNANLNQVLNGAYFVRGDMLRTHSPDQYAIVLERCRSLFQRETLEELFESMIAKLKQAQSLEHPSMD